MQVDGQVWDLERPLEASCKLELLDFEHPEGTSSIISQSPPPEPDSFAKENGCSGILQLTSLAKPRNAIMDATSV